jgi:hypothetical protein
MQIQANPIQQLIMNVLSQPRLAWGVTLLMSCFNMTSWISVLFIILLILRHGVPAVFNLMCANFVVNGVVNYLEISTFQAWLNSFYDYWPSYVGAAVLYYTRSWNMTGISMLSLLVFGTLGVHWVYPDFFNHELQAFILKAQQSVANLPLPIPFNALEQYLTSNTAFFGHLLMGMQLMMVIFNACINLTMARSFQSQLVNPNGFRQEMLSLRGNRYLFIALIASCGLVFSAKQWFLLLLMPSVLFYFFAVGLSILVSTFAKKRMQLGLIVLVLAAMVLPYVFIPLYVAAGALDSFIDFRLFLASRVKYTF